MFLSVVQKISFAYCKFDYKKFSIQSNSVVERISFLSFVQSFNRILLTFASLQEFRFPQFITSRMVFNLVKFYPIIAFRTIISNVWLRALPENVTEDFVISQMGLLNELLSPGLYEEDVTENLTLLDEIFDQNDYLIRDVIQQVSENNSNNNNHEIFVITRGNNCSGNTRVFESHSGLQVERELDQLRRSLYTELLSRRSLL